MARSERKARKAHQRRVVESYNLENLLSSQNEIAPANHEPR
jgi:hypothetical protein